MQYGLLSNKPNVKDDCEKSIYATHIISSSIQQHKTGDENLDYLSNKRNRDNISITSKPNNRGSNGSIKNFETNNINNHIIANSSKTKKRPKPSENIGQMKKNIKEFLTFTDSGEEEKSDGI